MIVLQNNNNKKCLLDGLAKGHEQGRRETLGLRWLSALAWGSLSPGMGTSTLGVGAGRGWVPEVWVLCRAMARESRETGKRKTSH